MGDFELNRNGIFSVRFVSDFAIISALARFIQTKNILEGKRKVSTAFRKDYAIRPYNWTYSWLRHEDPEKWYNIRNKEIEKRIDTGKKMLTFVIDWLNDRMKRLDACTKMQEKTSQYQQQEKTER